MNTPTSTELFEVLESVEEVPDIMLVPATLVAKNLCMFAVLTPPTEPWQANQLGWAFRLLRSEVGRYNRRMAKEETEAAQVKAYRGHKKNKKRVKVHA